IQPALTGAFWPVNGPAALARFLLEIGVGVDRHRIAGNPQHLQVPARIAEGGIRRAANYFKYYFRFSDTGWDANQTASDGAVLDLYCRREYLVPGNAEVLHGLADYPLIGRGYRPHITTRRLQARDQIAHFREDLPGEIFLEKLSSQAEHIGLAQPFVKGDHFAAHIVFADLARLIFGVAGARPTRHLGRDYAAREFPVEEALAGIARPERTVAVEYGKAGAQS